MKKKKKHFTEYQKLSLGKGVVYIQIIRWSKSLCVITEAQDVLRKFWIFEKMSGVLIPSIGNQNMLVLYLHVFCDSMFSIEIFSTHFTLICFKFLLHMKKHLFEVIPVMCNNLLDHKKKLFPQFSVHELVCMI